MLDEASVVCGGDVGRVGLADVGHVGVNAHLREGVDSGDDVKAAIKYLCRLQENVPATGAHGQVLKEERVLRDADTERLQDRLHAVG